MPVSLLLRIFQTRNLTLLWIGQVISQSGDSIFQIGLLWLTLELSGSESVTGLVAMASYLPAMLFSLPAGVVADRGDRRRILICSDGVRAIMILSIPLAWMLGFLTPLLLGIVAFILAISAAFFNPARDALIPQIAPREGLLRANSLIQTSWQFSLLLGPALAGGLLLTVGKIHLFTCDSLAYFLSFLFVFFIRLNPTTLDTSAPFRLRFGDVLDGLRYSVKHPVILPLLLITIADNIFIMGPAIVGAPVIIKEYYGLGAESYAFIQACLAIGMLLSTVMLLKWGGKFKKGSILLLGIVLDGITFVPVYYARTFEFFTLIIVIHSLAIPLLTVSRASLIQSIVPSRMIGRIFALVNLAVVGMSAVSSGLTGLALEFIEAPLLFLIVGFGGALCGIIGWIFAGSLKKA